MISLCLHFHSAIMFCELLQKKPMRLFASPNKGKIIFPIQLQDSIYSLDTRKEVRNCTVLRVCFFNWMHRLKIHNNINIVYKYVINPKSARTLLFRLTWLMILMHMQNEFKSLCKTWSISSFKTVQCWMGYTTVLQPHTFNERENRPR